MVLGAALVAMPNEMPCDWWLVEAMLSSIVPSLLFSLGVVLIPDT